MIVVDASALVAIADFEPDRMAYLERLSRAEQAVIAGVNAIEVGIVLVGRNRLQDAADLDQWLQALGIEVEPSAAHADVLGAYLLYGRGRHPARLNLGDCFAYALAKSLDAPLLYKGDDFALTDVRSALD